MTKPKIILASASLGRKELLKKIGVNFEVLVSNVDEDKINHKNPIKTLQSRAHAKAEDVIEKIIQLSNYPINTNNPIQTNLKSLIINHKSCLIIAADSMAVLNHKTYGKAKNKQEAQKILHDLMGKTHEFVTATTIVYLKLLKSPKLLKFNNITTTKVTMRSLNNHELEEYTTLYDFSRFAAAYTINDAPYDLITKIDGSYTNVIGLPFEIILPIFRKLEII